MLSAPTELELYDVRGDVGELREVSAEHPDIVARLLGFAERTRSEIGDMATIGKGQRPAGLVEDPKALVPDQ